MSRKCPHCDATCTDGDIEEDDTGQKVCGQCGAVLESAGFQNDTWDTGNFQPLVPEHQPSSTLPQGFLDGVRSVHRKRPDPEGKTAAVTKIKHLLQFMGVQGSKLMVPDCISLYTRIYMDKIFHNCTIWKKEILAGCCVYIVCREQDVPVTISHLSMLLGCPPERFWSLLRKIQKELGITCKGLDMDEAIDSLCTTLEMEDNVRVLVKRLLPIVKHSWITEGRSLEAAVKAASFIAWQSLNVSERAALKYQAFARKRKWTTNVKSSTVMHQEMLEMLLTLARAIPWLTSEISFKLALYHLGDILQYQRTIFQNLTQSKEKVSQDQELPARENTPDPRVGDAVDLSQETSQVCNAQVCNVQDEYVYCATSINDTPEKEVKSDGKTATKRKCFTEKHLMQGKILRITPNHQSKIPTNSDVNLFLPHSFLSSEECKSSPANASNYHLLSEEQLNNLDSEEVTDLDLDSKEMWRYIKSPQEIADTQSLKKLLDIRNEMAIKASSK